MKKIKRDFKSGDKRSLILAVDQLTTGITLDDCDMVALMNDWRSVDKYVQASFRCQSPREDKKNCWVLDFNAARSFELMWEYQNIISKNNGKSLTENISEWIECVNIFNRIEGEMIKIDFDGFNNEYNKSVLERPRFNYQSVILQDKLGHDNISKALMTIGIKGSSSSSDEDLNDDGIDKGKSKKSDKKSGGKGKVDEGISQVKLMEIAKALVDKTMLLSIFTYFKYDNVDDCFEGIGELEKKMYLETLLLGMNDVDNINLSVIKFIYDNIYDKEIINKKLYLFNQNVNLIYNSIGENPGIISDMLVNLMELVDSYLKPSNTEKRLLGEVFTPLYGKSGCVEDQLNLMDESFWKRKDVKVLDPCSGIGNYSVVLVDKFMKGLIEEFPNSEERLKWILEEIIYINEYQSKNLFIYLQLFDSENKYKMNFNKGDYLKLDIKETFGVEKFDLICMNPPYQSSSNDIRGSKSIYNDFVEKSIKDSNNVIFISPSKWFINEDASDFRRKMINDFGLKSITNVDDLFKDSADIKGGVSYVLLQKDYTGPVLFDGSKIKFKKFISKNEILIEKFSKMKTLSEVFNSGGYFNIETNDIRLSNKGRYKCYASHKNGNIKYIDIDCNKENLSKYKVLVLSASGSKKNISDMGRMIVSYPNEVHTSSFSHFVVDSKEQGDMMIKYLNTKMIKYLISLKKITQRVKKDTFSLVPIIPFDREWTDELLFDYFNLTQEERNIVLNYDKKL
jgi:hypothetical protein